MSLGRRRTATRRQLRTTIRVAPDVVQPRERTIEIIRWAAAAVQPELDGGVLVEVYRGNDRFMQPYGMANQTARSALIKLGPKPPTALHLIRLWLPPVEHYPRWEWGSPRKGWGNGIVMTTVQGRWPVHCLYSWEESLVAITAHEFRHIWSYCQGAAKRPKRPEVDAEWASARELFRWREENRA